MPDTAAPRPGTARTRPPPSLNGSGPPRPAPAAPPAPEAAHPDRPPPAGLITSAGRSRIMQLVRIMRRTFRRP
jgi:hypothetical protein